MRDGIVISCRSSLDCDTGDVTDRVGVIAPIE